MTLQQLEQRLGDLERQVNKLRRVIRQLCRLPQVHDTFGMFANDPEFDEIIRLGRECREQGNTD